MTEATARKRAAIMGLLEEGASTKEIIGLLRPSFKASRKDVCAAREGLTVYGYENLLAIKGGFKSQVEIEEALARKAGFKSRAQRQRFRIERNKESVYKYQLRKARERGFEGYGVYRNDLAQKKDFNTDWAYRTRLDKIPMNTLMEILCTGESHKLDEIAKRLSESLGFTVTAWDVKKDLESVAMDGLWFTMGKDNTVRVDKSHWFVKELLQDTEVAGPKTSAAALQSIRRQQNIEAKVKPR